MAEERVQRRLAAILAADVSGYSRLMGEDEEGTLAALTSLRGARRNGAAGRIVMLHCPRNSGRIEDRRLE